jgi:Legionella pneumophila major outer membrane protein precursor
LAGPNEDPQARIDALEKENAAFRKEIAALRENKALLKKSAPLKTSVNRAQPAQGGSMQTKGDVFSAYAADMPVAYKARPLVETRGQFRVWGEGGAIWSAGDPIRQDFSLIDFTTIPFGKSPGVFDLTPKVGWEAATGFDYRFAGSPWHVSGQFRYGDARNSGYASSAGNSALVIAPISAINGNETIKANYTETHWTADLAAGRDVLGDGSNAMQVKFGLRLSELVGKTGMSDNTTENLTFAPALLVPGFPPLSAAALNFSTLTDQRSSFLGAGPRIGIEGSVPLAAGWAFDYLGDVAALLGNQRLANTTTTMASFTPASFVVAFGPPPGGTSITTSDQRFATVFNADIQAGVSYWVTQNVKLSASYRLDAFFGVFNQTFTAGRQTADRYIHGPRAAVTAQF